MLNNDALTLPVGRQRGYLSWKNSLQQFTEFFFGVTLIKQKTKSSSSSSGSGGGGGGSGSSGSSICLS